MTSTHDLHHLPDFRLPSSKGQTLERQSFVEKVPLVVFFLPSVTNPADRDVIREYDEHLKDFADARVQVLGVVKETARRLRSLADRMGIELPLLADAGGDMIRDFDAQAPDGSARRVTVLSDRHGRILRRFDPSPPGQASAILSAIRSMPIEDLSDDDAGAAEPPG